MQASGIGGVINEVFVVKEQTRYAILSYSSFTFYLAGLGPAWSKTLSLKIEPTSGKFMNLGGHPFLSFGAILSPHSLFPSRSPQRFDGGGFRGMQSSTTLPLWLAIGFFMLDIFHHRLFVVWHRYQNEAVPQQGCLTYDPDFYRLYATYQMSVEEWIAGSCTILGNYSRPTATFVLTIANVLGWKFLRSLIKQKWHQMAVNFGSTTNREPYMFLQFQLTMGQSPSRIIGDSPVVPYRREIEASSLAMNDRWGQTPVRSSTNGERLRRMPKIFRKWRHLTLKA